MHNISQKLRNRYFFIVALVLAFFTGIFIGNFKIIKSQGTLFGKEVATDSDYFRYYNMFRETYQILKEEYVDINKIHSKTLLSGAIKGMLAATEDPYTDFLTPEVAKEFAANINGSFYGVGIRIEMRNNWLTVVAPIAGTPASKGELQPSDQIIGIDKESTEGLTSLEAVSKIRGKLGTSVQLTILRPGILQPFDIKLKRAKIDIDTVESDIINYKNKKIAYVKLIEFGVPTAKEFKKSLKELLKENPEGLILDVRNNPGGLLTSVAEITDAILDKGLIVYTRGRIVSENFEFKASKRNTLIDIKLPIIILANQGSASASEILVGALKDTKRGTVVGKTSFGKGCVQKTHPLSDGSIIKYTIAKYYTPAGHAIAKIGIKPDIEANMWYDDLTDEEKTSIIKLQISNIIPNFLEKNNDPKTEDIKALYNELSNKKYDFAPEILEYLIKQRQSFTSTNIYDLSMDAQLVKGLDTIVLPQDEEKTIYYTKPKTLGELQIEEKKALEEYKKSQTNEG